MLTSLSIGNFKAFGETQTIPIRPITLIFGANSSGKSSILHSLLLANHALETGNWDVREPRLGGGSVDLGGVAQYLHGGAATGTCHFGYGLSGKVYGQDKTFEVKLTVGVSPADGTGVAKDTPAIAQKVELAIEGQPAVTFAPNGTDAFRGDRIDAQNEILRHLARWAIERVDQEQRPKEMQAAKAVLDALFREAEGGRSPLELGPEGFKEWIETAIGRETERAQAESPEAVRIVFWRLVSDKKSGVTEVVSLLEQASKEVSFTLFSSQVERIRGDEMWDDPRWELYMESAPAEDLASDYSKEFNRADKQRKEQALLVMRELRSQIKTAFCSLNEVVASLRYLGPLRAIPKRHRVQWDDASLHDRPGLDSWARIGAEVQVQEVVNRWLGSGCFGTPFRLKTRRLVYDDDPSKGIGPPDLLFEDSSSRLQLSHRDLGFGITQALPILVNAASPNKGIVAIEQPELHLHPAMQAELGDVFIESALGERKNTFLLETHSEHLILRILRRIRETTAEGKPGKEGLPPIRPEDVSVVYVQPGPKGAEVIELPVTADGDFSRPWPKGFFAERAAELF